MKYYCKAPFVSASVWPGNSIAPCCLWEGPGWNTVDNMKHELSNQFSNGDIPAPCQGCTYRHEFNKYDEKCGLQMLDIRNDNLCNLRCRSCTPTWSSRIAQEENIYPVRNFLSLDLDQINWDNVSSIYLCGGEPFISHQHREILSKIKHPEKIKLHYNTNCTILTHQGIYIPDLWKPFKEVIINASIDAVGEYAEVVRSGCKWAEVDAVLTELEQLASHHAIHLNVVPYVSALNIWWMDSWLKRFDSWDPSRIQPIISDQHDFIGLSIIPKKFRVELIELLCNSKFSQQFSKAIYMLINHDNTKEWDNFLFRQRQIDSNRSESWVSKIALLR